MGSIQMSTSGVAGVPTGVITDEPPQKPNENDPDSKWIEYLKKFFEHQQKVNEHVKNELEHIHTRFEHVKNELEHTHTRFEHVKNELEHTHTRFDRREVMVEYEKGVF